MRTPGSWGLFFGSAPVHAVRLARSERSFQCGRASAGAQIELPLCGIYTFDDDDRLAGERIYYDRATLRRQLGVFHEPDRAVGRTTLLTHPLTMAQVVGRKILKWN
jgi:hypothetical protein